MVGGAVGALHSHVQLSLILHDIRIQKQKNKNKDICFAVIVFEYLVL